MGRITGTSAITGGIGSVVVVVVVVVVAAAGIGDWGTAATTGIDPSAVADWLVTAAAAALSSLLLTGDAESRGTGTVAAVAPSMLVLAGETDGDVG